MNDQTQTDDSKPHPRRIRAQAGYWLEEIRLAAQSVERWHKRGEKITKRYRDERPDEESSLRKFNVLWSNTETLLPVVYARTPKPEVQRRFLDKDPIGKVAAEVLERSTAAMLDLYDFDGIMQACVKDYLLAGRGQAWVRYQADFGQDQAVTYERLLCDYVPWKDFLTNPARVWAEVRWCAKRTFLSRDELVKQFGEIGRTVPLDSRPTGVDESDPQKMERVAKATVWEIWDRTSGKVWFIHPGYSDAPLKEVPAPFKLDGFFPCPRPLTATTANDSIIPTPDYAEYQDQAEELDDLTARIGAMQKALKVIGVYDSSVTALQNLLNDGADNQMVPVDQWASFASKGGLEGVVSFLPVKEVAETLIQLYAARKAVKEDLYEITGISDILRGSSDSSETATAQQIKSQWGSIRVKDRQKEAARFSRDLIRIKCEILAEIASPETLALMSGAQQMGPQVQQMWPQVMELLRDGAQRNFRVDIETDSTIQPDEEQEKRSVTEFLSVLAPMLKEGLPAAQMAPPLLPVIGEIITAAARRFRFGRQLETVIEQAFQQMQQMAQQKAQQPPPPDPEMVKAEGQLKVAQAKAQGEMQIEQQRLQGDMMIEQQRAQNDMQIDQFRAQTDAKARMVEAANRPVVQ
jgi:hypothetical protein